MPPPDHPWQDLGLVLAAGAGRRFGGPKAPVLVEGERLVDRAVRVLQEGGCAPVLVVLGAWVGAVAAAQTTVNPDWRQGMGSSLRHGLQWFMRQPGAPARRALITLVDLPGLTGAAVRELRRSEADLVAARYGGRQGHPVLIGEAHWPALIAELRGDRGARDYLRRHQAQLISLDHLADGDDLDHDRSNAGAGPEPGR